MTTSRRFSQSGGVENFIKQLRQDMEELKIRIHELEVNAGIKQQKKFHQKGLLQKKRPMTRRSSSANDLSKLLHLKEALRQNTDEFIQDITLSGGTLLDRLFEDCVLTEADYYSIASRNTDIDKVKLMLVKIKDSSPDIIEEFLNILAQDQSYEHLSVKVNQSLQLIKNEDSGKAVCVVCLMKSTVDINDIVGCLYRENLISDELYSDIVNQQGLVYCFKEFIWKEIIAEVQRTKEKGLGILKEALDSKYKHIVTSLDKLPMNTLPDCWCMKRRAKRPRPKNDPGYDSSTDAMSTTSTVIYRHDSTTDMTDTEPESSVRTVIANETLTTDIETDIEFTADPKAFVIDNNTSTELNAPIDLGIATNIHQNRNDIDTPDQENVLRESEPSISTKPGPVEAWPIFSNTRDASDKTHTQSSQTRSYVEASTSPIEKFMPENVLSKMMTADSSITKGNLRDKNRTTVTKSDQTVTANKAQFSRTQLLKTESSEGQMKRVKSLPEMKSVKNGRTKRFRSPARRQRAQRKDSTSANSTSTSTDSESDTTTASAATVRYVGTLDSRRTSDVSQHSAHTVHPSGNSGSEPAITSPESDNSDPLTSLPSKPHLMTDRIRNFAERRPSDGMLFSKSDTVLEHLGARSRSNSGPVRKLPVSTAHRTRVVQKPSEIPTRSDNRLTKEPIAIPKSRPSNGNEEENVYNTSTNTGWIVGSPESDKVTSPDEISINIESAKSPIVMKGLLKHDNNTENNNVSNSLEASIKRAKSLPAGMFKYDTTRKRKLPQTKLRTSREIKTLPNQSNRNQPQVKTKGEPSRGDERTELSNIRPKPNTSSFVNVDLQNSTNVNDPKHASGDESANAQLIDTEFTSLEDNFSPVRKTKVPFFFGTDTTTTHGTRANVNNSDQQLSVTNKDLSNDAPSTGQERPRVPVRRTQSLTRRRHKSPSGVTRLTGAVTKRQEGVFHPVISHQPRFNFSQTENQTTNEEHESFV